MPYNREGYAPWSLTRKAGVQSATVDGTIEVPQYCQPTLNTGFVDEKGDWKGIKSSEEQFNIITKDEAIPNGAAILTPSENPDGTWPLDMTGYTDLFIAIKPTNGGNYKMEAVMGPDSVSYANLRPVNAAAVLRGLPASFGTNTGVDNLLLDSADSMTADVWNIFVIQGRLANYKLLQFRITNDSGGESTIECAFMRMIR
jgi:hypothetical protein